MPLLNRVFLNLVPMNNPFVLTGKRILVTGASSGIGRATAILLSQLGASLVVSGRDVDRLASTLAQLHGDGHVSSVFDLSDHGAIGDWLVGLTSDNPRLDGLIYSAGIQVAKPLRVLTQTDTQHSLGTNVAAAIEIVKGFRQRPVNNAGGSVVLLASVMGLVGQPGQVLYSATKGAIVATVRSMALELARERIRVNCIAPGLVQTEMMDRLREKTLTPEAMDQIAAHHPLGIGEPIDVAHAAAFLVADASRWVTGTCLVVDGGYTAH